MLGAALLMWIAVEGKRKQGKSNAELNIKAESRAETKHQPGHTYAHFFQAASFFAITATLDWQRLFIEYFLGFS